MRIDLLALTIALIAGCGGGDDVSSADAGGRDSAPGDPPTVAITRPLDESILSTPNDCSGDPGMQVAVAAATDAAAGSDATVAIAGQPAVTTTVSASAIEVCADAPDGRDVTIEVTVVDTARGSATDSVTATVDTLAPPDAIDDLAATVVDRRAGIVSFSWTAVADAGGLTLSSYQLRCAPAPIADEAEWAAAQPHDVVLSPAGAGTAQSAQVSGFRTAVARSCVIRAADPTGALTPLPGASAPVSPAFATTEVTVGGSVRLGSDIAGVGDVNGDGIDDAVITGGTDAWIYFGAAGSLPGAPATRIIGSAGFVLDVAGVGDFNGDGRPDFVVGVAQWAPDGGPANRGAAFLFYGRAAAWPASIAISTTGGICSGPDVCFLGDDGVAASGPDELARLGFSVDSAGDFDGDGLMDLAVGAPSSGVPLPGRVYVLLGDATDYPSGSAVSVPGTGSGPDGFVVEGDAAVRRLLGSVVASVGGDLDGDARHDLLVQSAGGGTGLVAARVDRLPGRSHVADSGLVAIALTALDPVGVGAGPGTYGRALAAADDIDGDGLLDVLVHDGAGGGIVEMHFGQASGFSGGEVSTIANDVASPGSDQFGATLGGARHPALGDVGDLDGDQRSDLLIGSVEEGTVAGRADFFYGIGARTGRARLSRDVALGPPASSLAPADGVRAAFIGDLDDDGFDDVAVGDPAFSTGVGRVTIHH